jgi:hypothetical protein
MKTWLQLVAVVALGYWLWAYGIPWIRREVGRSSPPVSSPARGAGGTCVQTAARASEELHERMLDSARPLVDAASWREAVDEVDASLQQARQACDCALESCARVRDALAAMSEIFESARAQFRSSQSVPLELARRYEQANQELWDGYDLAREGR